MREARTGRSLLAEPEKAIESAIHKGKTATERLDRLGEALSLYGDASTDCERSALVAVMTVVLREAADRSVEAIACATHALQKMREALGVETEE